MMPTFEDGHWSLPHTLNPLELQLEQTVHGTSVLNKAFIYEKPGKQLLYAEVSYSTESIPASVPPLPCFPSIG